jgi:hypothetical protein
LVAHDLVDVWDGGTILSLFTGTSE